MDSRSCTNIKVLMYPWLAHGHISPYLELAKKLSKRNFYIYLCSTSINLSPVRAKLPEKDSLSIELVEIQLPSLPDLPPHHHTTNGLPPHLMPTLKDALHMARPNFSRILHAIKPDLVIYDFIQDWAPEEASLLNIPAVLFLTAGAATNSLMLHYLKNANFTFPFPAISFTDFEKIQIDKKIAEDSKKDYSEIDQILRAMKQSSGIIMIKSCRVIEAKYIDYTSVLAEKKIVTVGSLVQEPVDDKYEHNKIIEWLNKKGQASTVFVSFGSEYFLSKEEMEEIAHGLELSKVNFVWVVRVPSGEKFNIEEALPDGFLERTKERGLIVEGWAPQGRILKHSSIGGFVSHCGWSSVMEGLKFGVPIIGMPMQLDQPINSRLGQEIGAAVEVKRDKEGKFDRNEVAKVVSMILVEKAGEGVRRKVRDICENMAKKEDEEIDGVVEELEGLCNKL